MRSASVSFIFFAICVLNLHCQEDEKNSHLNKLNRDTATSLQNDTNHKIIGDTVWTWVDTIVINYIKNTRNELISLARKILHDWNGIKRFRREMGSNILS